jgi:hypothetical protein
MNLFNVKDVGIAQMKLQGLINFTSAHFFSNNWLVGSPSSPLVPSSPAYWWCLEGGTHHVINLIHVSAAWLKPLSCVFPNFSLFLSSHSTNVRIAKQTYRVVLALRQGLLYFPSKGIVA